MREGTRSMREVPVIAEALFSYQIGGSERVAVDLAVEIRRRGYRVVCFAFHDSDGPMRAELERSGVSCVDMNYDEFRGVFKRVHYLWACWQMLRRERVRALHVHHAAALILSGIPALLARVNRVVMTEHGLQALKDQPRYRRSAAHYCRYADHITVVEPAQADYFRAQLGVPSSKLRYVANGVRLPPTRSAECTRRMRQKLALPDDVFAYLYVGRLSPEKDLGTLLDAFAALPADVSSRSRLYLVGDGSDRPSLEARCAALGLVDRAIFLGARTDVSEILTAADAFAMSSATEGLPMVLLEAMAARVPCVATAVGGIPGLFADGKGLIVPPHDSAKLAEAMASIARSPELREYIVANALEHVRRNHALDLIVDQYLSLLGLPPSLAGASTQESATPGTD